MNLRFLSVLLILAAVLTCCLVAEASDGELDKSKPGRVGPGQYSYGGDGRGPENWGSLLPEYAACSAGKEQSPINVLVDTTQVPKFPQPNIGLMSSVVDFESVSLNFNFKCSKGFGECSGVKWNKTTYNMLQVHGHVPSENHVGGVPYPLELHFVHVSKNSDLLVFGVLFELGEEKNEHLQTLIDAAEEIQPRVADLTKFVDKTSTLCTWAGSLTTPPCSEGVRWILSTKPQKATLKQIGCFFDMMGNKITNRPLQPLNDRTVQCWPNKYKSNGEIIGGLLK